MPLLVLRPLCDQKGDDSWFLIKLRVTLAAAQTGWNPVGHKWGSPRLPGPSGARVGG